MRAGLKGTARIRVAIAWEIGLPVSVASAGRAGCVAVGLRMNLVKPLCFGLSISNLGSILVLRSSL